MKMDPLFVANNYRQSLAYVRIWFSHMYVEFYVCQKLLLTVCAAHSQLNKR